MKSACKSSRVGILAIILILLFIFGSLLITDRLGKSSKTAYVNSSMQLRSTDFVNGGNIPAKFTCDGEGISPALEIGGVPENAKSLAIVLDDPDAPSGTFTHWVVWNIPIVTDKIAAGSLPMGAKEGLNSARSKGYIGPCPPSGTHNYIFNLYALDVEITDLNPDEATRKSLFDKMTGHIVGTAELVGLYTRQ